jgi:nucleoside-diphosphate-sugar epimerase
MQDKRILVAGYGKLGRRVARQLAEQHTVYALKRNPQAPDGEVKLCFADIAQLEDLTGCLQQAIPDGVDYLIYCLSPGERSEQGYRAAYLTGLKNILTALPGIARLRHVIFVSSTSVYHQCDDEWVDEQSPCQPVSFSGKILREAEQFLQSQPVASTIVRFSGIYGGGRSRLIEQVRQALENNDPIKLAEGYTNRIHEDDCVGFLCHLMELLDQEEKLEPMYLATDSAPVPLAQVYQFIGEQLQDGLSANEQCTLQLEISSPLETGSTAKALRRAGSKRCCNTLLLNSGYELTFPTYREGYARCQAEVF